MKNVWKELNGPFLSGMGKLEVAAIFAWLANKP